MIRRHAGPSRLLLFIALTLIMSFLNRLSAEQPNPKEIVGVAGVIKYDIEGSRRFGCEKRLLKAGTLVAFGSGGIPDWRTIDEKKGLVRVAYRAHNSDVMYYCTWVPKEAVEKFQFQCNPNDLFQTRGFFGFPWLPSADRQNWVWNPSLLTEAETVANSMKLVLIKEVINEKKA